MLKNIILWNYPRGSRQYDVFCLLIIAFIFLTPKAWFDKREKLATQTARLIVKQADFLADKRAMENKIKELSGNEQAEIVEWNERRAANGEIFYEISVR